MPRRPLALYQTLLGLVPGQDEAERVRALRAMLRRPAQEWPAEVGDALAASGVSSGYLQRGLLSIHGFSPDVREALERGLPFALARLVNGISDELERSRVLAPLAGVAGAGETALLPRGLSRRIERDARAARLRERTAQCSESAAAGADGWLPSDAQPATPAPLAGSVWTFTPAAGGALELLAERVVEGLLARLLPHGGSLVDVTAGVGTIARVARRFGVRSWSGDIAPGAPFVQYCDARTLLLEPPAGIERSCADLLVIHPPTFPVWHRSAAAGGDIEAYRDEVEAMIGGSLGVVKPGGHVVVISRPVRRPGAVWLATSHLAQALEDASLRVVGYVVAVAQGGTDDWHLLIGHAPRRG